MVQREIDVVQRVANFVSDGRCQSSHHRGFFDLMELRLQFAQAPELRDHVIEGGSQRAHFISAICRHANVEVAGGYAPRRH